MEKTHKYRLCGSLPAKIIAMVLLICSCFSTVISGIGVLYLDSHDVYIKSKTDVQKEYFDKILSKYSVGAVTGKSNQYRYDELKNTNFRYGVICTREFDKVDITDRNNYVFNDFDDRFDTLKSNKENLHIYSCNFNSATDYEYNNSLFGDAYIMNHNGMGSGEVDVPITGAFYDWQTKQFYLSDGSYLYSYYGPVEVNSYEDGEECVICLLEDALYLSTVHDEASEQEEKRFNWKYADETVVTLDNGVYQMLLKEVQIVNTAQLSEVADLSNGFFEAYGIEDTGFMKTNNRIDEKDEIDQYYVISYVADPIVMGATFETCDLFGQVTQMIDFAYQWKYIVVAVLLVSLAIAIASFSFLCAAAGRRKDKEELVGHIWDKLPLDLTFFGVLITDICLLMLAGSVAFGYAIESVMDFCRVTNILAFGICGTICVIISQGWVMSLAYHIKKKDALKDTCIYRFFRWITNLWRKLKGSTREVLTDFNVYRYSLLMLILFGVVQFVLVFLASTDAAAGVLFWFIEMALLLALGIKLTRHLKQLEDGAAMLAAGDLDHRVNTQNMIAPLKKHGEQLNAISDGMNTAVAQRMKSERFKTELITNVSHDIKTPLTSIINYVDLLGKEELDNEKAKEYLEVLARQSEKLKKLIEDLIEASKASTGNLSVDITNLDASVVMTQVVGEFEEKLSANNIELLVQTPENAVRILADSRHLWRVFDNLLNNICKYAMPGTRAYVNVEKYTDTTARIVFKNISKDALNISSEELMERFVRADSSRHTEGNGLGLSIARSLMELMGGSLELTVDGDLFKVELNFRLAK